MKVVSYNGLDLWAFDSLSNEPGLRHFVSGRKSPYEKEFTLSFSSSPSRDEIVSNRKLLADALGIHDTKLVFPSQVHLTRIVEVTDQTPKEELQNTDALITQTRGICIAVMSADCVPILLYDKKNQAIAAVHSGWRGTVAKILQKTLQTMKETFGTSGNDIVAGIGPSVSQQSYEVGEEVIEEVHKTFGKDSELMVRHAGKKAKLDLWKANEKQLLEFGVQETNIEISNLCTVIHNQHFFSARKGDSGRFAAGIMLR